MGNSLAWFSSAPQDDFPLVSEQINFNQSLGIQPNSPITLIRVSGKLENRTESLALELEFDEPSATIKKLIRIDYKPRLPSGCLVEWYQDRTFKEKVLEDQSFSDALYESLDIVLRHQKSPLETFEVNITVPDFYKSGSIMDDRQPVAVDLLNNIKKSLEFRRHPLQVKNLIVKESGGSQLLKILPFLDSAILESIDIEDPRRAYDSYELPLVVILDQWKNARKLRIENYKMVMSVEQLKHFDELHLDYWEFSVEDVVELKKAFLKSYDSKTHWKLMLPEFTDNSKLQKELIDKLGTPFHVVPTLLSKTISKLSVFKTPEEGRKWFFKFEGAMEVLYIHLTSRHLSFEKIAMKDVPEEGRKFIQFDS
ncbi:hypothetical protein GCK72_021413 [Caenorhabditis remanei]|uniref:DUF38 domain-containing protein n=1 Tax=Caenorhabditis remanei TaxID=31234 RepID=A0A6A5GI29_CAERE|nr:hypothetical protein GCK72_021413 [Caenorhabditis remanei]KAF1754848.1 hypothetical protein GCK72_021413 [Caenorhabditis remanei]